jgi:hypothetical protein
VAAAAITIWTKVSAIDHTSIVSSSDIAGSEDDVADPQGGAGGAVCFVIGRAHEDS